MSLPAGYSYGPGGVIMKEDGTGPYTISDSGVATLVGYTFQGVGADYTPGPNGLYFHSDGSGPYAKKADGFYLYFG